MDPSRPAASASPTPSGLVAAVISRKGGVGKTTTSVNLAAALARQGKKTLLIDLDGQASASLSLGVERSQFSPSSADVLLRGLPAVDATRRTKVQNLDLMTASTDLGQLDTALAARSQKEQRLKQVLDPLRSLYDVILMDCAPWQSLLGINALVAADRYIVPVVPQFLAMEGVANLVHAAERLRETLGARVQLLGILLSMVDYRLKLTRQAVDHLRSRYGPSVFGIEMRVNVRLAEAPEYGQTIFEYDLSSTGAKLFELLAEEFLLRAGLPSNVADEMPALR
jgi:chromosome partitioning protein